MRPDVEYCKQHGSWGEPVDRLNDVFNYTLALPAARAMASRIPGARVAHFPLPTDWPAANQPGDLRRFAFTWLPRPGEETLSATSQILTISGKMLAGVWCEEERMSLLCAKIEEGPFEQGACECVVSEIASRLPWMRDCFENALPQWSWEQIQSLLDEVIELINLPSGSFSRVNIGAPEAWEHMAADRRFSFAAEARLLQDATPPASSPAKRSRRV